MQKYGEEMNLFAKLALTPKGWAKNVRVIVDQFGRITTVESGVDPSPEDQQLWNRILLPALSNLHSHSFQRAMAGLTEKRLKKEDSFWSWQKLMYDFLQRLLGVAIPRERDFRGLDISSFDGRGNYAIGIREHIIFPEILSL